MKWLAAMVGGLMCVRYLSERHRQRVATVPASSGSSAAPYMSEHQAPARQASTVDQEEGFGLGAGDRITPPRP